MYPAGLTHTANVYRDVLSSTGGINYNVTNKSAADNHHTVSDHMDALSSQLYSASFIISM